MWRFEVQYEEDGITKGKGFGYRDKYEAFLRRLGRKPNVKLLQTWDNDKGIHTEYRENW